MIHRQREHSHTHTHTQLVQDAVQRSTLSISARCLTFRTHVWTSFAYPSVSPFCARAPGSCWNRVLRWLQIYFCHSPFVAFATGLNVSVGHNNHIEWESIQNRPIYSLDSRTSSSPSVWIGDPNNGRHKCNRTRLSRYSDNVRQAHRCITRKRLRIKMPGHLYQRALCIKYNVINGRTLVALGFHSYQWVHYGSRTRARASPFIMYAPASSVVKQPEHIVLCRSAHICERVLYVGCVGVVCVGFSLLPVIGYTLRLC